MTTIGLSLAGVGVLAFVAIRFMKSDGWILALSLAAIFALAAGAMLLSFQIQYTPPRAALAAPAYVPIAGSAINTRICDAHALFEQDCE